ncbi:hypothetical protein HYY75_11615 [bacterium]|nr:hypothetical protein [bacterium]
MLTPETSILCDKEIKVLKEMREGNTVSGASGWGEIAKCQIQDVFVQYDYKGPVFSVKTNQGHLLKCTPDHPCFARFNPSSHHFHLFLMERSTFGFRVGLSQGLIRDLFAAYQQKTDFSAQQEVIDRFWILEATENSSQAIFLTKYIMFKYGLPDVQFPARGVNSEFPEELVRELFNRIDTPSRAKQVLHDSYMFEEFPHVTMRLSSNKPSRSNAIQFIIFGGTSKIPKRPGFSHLIRIDSSANLDSSDSKKFQRRMSTHGLWHLEVTRDDLEEAKLFVKTLSHLDDLEVVKKIQLTKKGPFYILPASHLKIGMSVPVLGNRGIEEDTISSISHDEFEGPLYDLKVQDLYNYVAGKWVVMANTGSSAIATWNRRVI